MHMGTCYKHAWRDVDASLSSVCTCCRAVSCRQPTVDDLSVFARQVHVALYAPTVERAVVEAVTHGRTVAVVTVLLQDYTTSDRVDR